MRRPEPLPSRLGRAFRVSAALSGGVGAGRLRGGDLGKRFRGARTLVDDPVLSYAPLLRPGDRFSHTTAALLWGGPVDDRTVVHVTSGSATPGSGVSVSRGISQGSGQRSCAPDFRCPIRSRPSSSARPCSASTLVRLGAESRAETRLRLLLVRAGIPEPVLGYELTDAEGRRVGWFDMAWPESRLIVEYDGDQHRVSTEQYERDITRFDLAAELSWLVIRVRSHGLHRDPAGTVARVRRALAASAQGVRR